MSMNSNLAIDQYSDESGWGLYDLLPDAVFVFDESGCVLDGNTAAENLIGYRRDELLGVNIFELGLLSPDQLELAMSRFGQVEVGRPFGPFEYDLVHRDGHVTPIESLSHAIVVGGERRIIGIARDISERKQREAALQESEARIRVLTSQMPTMVWTTDRNLRVTYAAGTVLQRFRIRATDLIGVSIPERFGDLEIAESAIGTQRRALDGESGEYSFEFGSRWFDVHVEPLRNDAGDINGAIGAAFDATERRLAEARLADDNQRLERRVADRTDELERSVADLKAFNAALAHDLRSPLQSISGFSELLEDSSGTTLSEEGVHYLDSIRAAVRRMGKILEGLRSLSRIGLVTVHREPLELGVAAKKIFEGLKAHEPDRHVELTLGDDLTANCDPRLAQVILENLIGNAWKFTGRRERAHIEVGALPSGEDGPVFYVRDNGIGFDPSQADELFEPFAKAHVDHRFAGTGLGLATVQRAVTQQCGRVWGEGVTDGGATFYFTLGC